MSFGFVDLIGIIKGFYIYINLWINTQSKTLTPVSWISTAWSEWQTICIRSAIRVSSAPAITVGIYLNCYQALNLLSLCAILWILLLMQFQNFLFVHSSYDFCMMVLLSKLCTCWWLNTSKKFHNAPLHETLKGYSGYTYE